MGEDARAPKTVYVTPAQIDAAKILVERSTSIGRPLPAAVLRIAQAESQPPFRSETPGTGPSALPKTVYVTPAQIDAARILVERSTSIVCPLPAAVLRIAQAESQPPFRSETPGTGSEISTPADGGAQVLAGESAVMPGTRLNYKAGEFGPDPPDSPTQTEEQHNRLGNREPMSPPVFVNYRRTDEPFAAALVFSVLGDRWTGEPVFHDTRFLRQKGDVGQQQLDAVANSELVLAVMGRAWDDVERLETPGGSD